MKVKARIFVEGLVQGIGYRPFVYRIAVNRNLKGYVRNTGDAGVEIVVEGERRDVESFIEDLKEKKPPLAKYEKITITYEEYRGEHSDFRIIKSSKKRKSTSSIIPPDLGICEECIAEINGEGRRKGYAFTSCINCGPRFTVIIELPYDRETTTMSKFKMCDYCKKQYEDPLQRWYYAQTICCPYCGPQLEVYSSKGERIECEDPIKFVQDELIKGKIVAIKGIGGVHIACKTTDSEVIEKLRKKRGKKEKPLAIMSLNIDRIREYAYVSEVEEKILKSYARPIVLLKKKKPFPLAENLSPGLNTIGVMLPYTGLHYLLLKGLEEPALVMTSGNPPGQPTIINNEEALQKLPNIVDYLLLHNREIWNRCDDSVVKIVDNEKMFIRKSRGYVPDPIELQFKIDKVIVGVGCDLNNTFSIYSNGRIITSQHVGDLDLLETIRAWKEAYSKLKRLLNIKRANTYVADLHPTMNSVEIAKEQSKLESAEVIRVQHHKSHLASLMVEWRVEEVVGIVCDGVGYGEDGKIWGGEIFIGLNGEFERIGHLEEHPMPGGDLATKYPLRMLAGILFNTLGEDQAREALKQYVNMFKYGEKEVEIVLKQIKASINTPWTTSCGRVLDAASSALKVCFERTYEGEPAMKLEALASEASEEAKVIMEIEERGKEKIILTGEAISRLTLDDNDRRKAAYGVHLALARSLSEIAIETAKKEHIKTIGFTGGVAYNTIITREIRRQVEAAGLKFIRPIRIPAGDGGISIGQVAIAVWRER